MSKTSQPWVATLVRTIFDQPDTAEVHAQFARVVDALDGKLPAAEIWRQLWSSNPQEPLNRELRRRTDVVGIFPDRAALVRLVGAVLMEQNDEWTEARRYIGAEILAKTGTTPAAAADTPGEVTPSRQSAHEVSNGSSRCRLIHHDHGRGRGPGWPESVLPLQPQSHS